MNSIGILDNNQGSPSVIFFERIESALTVNPLDRCRCPTCGELVITVDVRRHVSARETVSKIVPLHICPAANEAQP
jgi:hypothetical protein